ncbi:OmpA family protein [Thermobrachium celere]|uniref:Flagellar motor rotation protein MotB n=1 Tax=Thermobrachium celere DSM 8682 TaxID=941824 RepID=R7RRP7_9CLOT|nr:OmpA family protein [Thermobrachium celere]CDF58011.1 Flagellar motor rotation protein MotB [Thermobrachium celere DSM 8682]
MSRRREKNKNSGGGGGEWLTTYADLMTLLLTFFVLLYSFSTIDAIKFKEISWSLAKALGGKTGVINNGGNLGPIPINQNPGEGIKNRSEISQDNGQTVKLLNEITKEIKNKNLDTKVAIKEDVRGVIIELQEKILFDTGRAELKTESIQTLSKIADILKKYPNEIIVEGHTDNIPINTGYYKTNWELSSDRAVKVVRYLVEEKGLNPQKIQAVGCGEFRPIASNETPEGRKKNRRVNILILTKDKGSN